MEIGREFAKWPKNRAKVNQGISAWRPSVIILFQVFLCFVSRLLHFVLVQDNKELKQQTQQTEENNNKIMKTLWSSFTKGNLINEYGLKKLKTRLFIHCSKIIQFLSINIFLQSFPNSLSEYDTKYVLLFYLLVSARALIG